MGGLAELPGGFGSGLCSALGVLGVRGVPLGSSAGATAQGPACTRSLAPTASAASSASPGDAEVPKPRRTRSSCARRLAAAGGDARRHPPGPQGRFPASPRQGGLNPSPSHFTALSHMDTGFPSGAEPVPAQTNVEQLCQRTPDKLQPVSATQGTKAHAGLCGSPRPQWLGGQHLIPFN